MYASYSLLQFYFRWGQKNCHHPNGIDQDLSHGQQIGKQDSSWENSDPHSDHNEKKFIARNEPTVKIIDLVEIIELLASDDDDDQADQWSGAPFRLVRREINCF